MKAIIFSLLVTGFCNFVSCMRQNDRTIAALAKLADGWHGDVVARVEQSYAGWDVEIGDADNDGLNEILTTGCPDSRLYLFKKTDTGWQTKLLAQNLAQHTPGMGLVVKIVDLNGDRVNEILLGTGQEMDEVALFYKFQIEGSGLSKTTTSQPELANSNYTHNLAPYDCDGDGIKEVFSAYCGSGEITRYHFDKDLTSVRAKKLHQLSGSGEESLIVDVDNDGQVEFLTSNSFRNEQAKVEIYELDERGDLVMPARLVIDGYDDKKCFYASLIAGDVDNDGKNELIVGWKQKQQINKTTMLGYRISGTATPLYTFAREDEALDMGYFEKMMVVADADNDGRSELIVSTRGDNKSENISSRHFGYVLMYKVLASHEIQKTIVVDFNDEKVESSWLAVGDADNDGKNEVVLATGKGDRTKPGISYVILVKK
jgi:hypothetical protein